MELETAGLTHVGRRANNEDSLLVEQELGLFVVADGMGGYEGGEVASALVIETMLEFFERNAEDSNITWPFGIDHERGLLENMVLVGLRQANREVLRRKEGSLGKMGSTAVVLVLRGREAVIGNVGDSRVYRMRDGVLERMTEDHSLRAELERAGHRPLPEGHLSNVITRAIGVSNELGADVRTVEAREGDVYLLCSDGLSGPLSEASIADLLYRFPPEVASRLLLEEALDSGGQDNITAVVVAVGCYESL